MNYLDIEAIYIGESINLNFSIEEFYMLQKEDTLIFIHGDQIIFVFSFGVVVFWNIVKGAQGGVIRKV